MFCTFVCLVKDYSEKIKYWLGEIYSVKMITKKDVVEALSQCKDPELDADIVNLGLIYGINVAEPGDVKITLTMTSAMCPVTSLILADAQLRLESIPNIGKVELELVWDPMWSPDMMSDEIKYRT
ncbi:FeS assembly SUF system protein [Candidatus Micrarchaeum sp.]|jgi:metal-sulfur cluster biosynthetic enzyme|nr:FeS assembly SUF system protein [Candidatus Micrarchaeum sp.]